MSMNLVQHVPKAMHEVANYEDNWHSNTQKTQNSEGYNASGFESPRSFIAKVRSERQIESRDWDEEQSEEGLLYLCRE